MVARETAFPALRMPHSRMERVGSGGVSSGRFAEARQRLLTPSLCNASSHDQLRAFDTPGAARPRAAARPSLHDLRYVAELKIHGLAIRLRYEAAVRAGRHARRRLDRRGRHHQLRTIRHPAELKEPATLEPGQVSTPKAEFARINAEREEAGLPLLCEPAQQRRGLPPPAGPGDHRQPGACRPGSSSSLRGKGSRPDLLSASWLR